MYAYMLPDFLIYQNKFKREEKKNPHLVAQALSKLLEVTWSILPQVYVVS